MLFSPAGKVVECFEPVHAGNTKNKKRTFRSLRIYLALPSNSSFIFTGRLKIEDRGKLAFSPVLSNLKSQQNDVMHFGINIPDSEDMEDPPSPGQFVIAVSGVAC